MFDEKKSILFPKSEVKEIEFNDQKFLVSPLMSNEEMAILIGIYLNELFNKDAVDPDFNLLRAKNSLIVSLIDVMTDIELPPASMNEILGNMNLVQNIKDSIENYYEFSQRLYETVDMVMESKRLEKSIGSVLEGITIKISDFLDNLSDSDKMNETINSARELLKESQDSPLVRATLNTFKEEPKG